MSIQRIADKEPVTQTMLSDLGQIPIKHQSFTPLKNKIDTNC